MKQPSLFDQPTGYSYQTSLPAYHDNAKGKMTQAEWIYSLVKRGHDCLKKLAEVTELDQSTVSGRVNDLIKIKMLMYQTDESGKVMTIEYKGRPRKKIVAL